MLRPKAVDVKPMDGYRLFVVFDNGEEKIYDAKPLIKGDWFVQVCNYDKL